MPSLLRVPREVGMIIKADGGERSTITSAGSKAWTVGLPELVEGLRLNKQQPCRSSHVFTQTPTTTPSFKYVSSARLWRGHPPINWKSLIFAANNVLPSRRGAGLGDKAPPYPSQAKKGTT